MATDHQTTSRPPSSKQIPKISSTRTTGNMGKENGLNLNILGSLGKSKTSMRPFSQRKTVGLTPSPLSARKSSSESPLSKTSPSIGGGAPRRRSVLRYGETIEATFGLNSDSAEDHWKLCRQLVADEAAADDPSTWKRILEYCESSSPLTDTDMVRLYRRSTSRFTNITNIKDLHTVFLLWIAFAKAQIRQRDYTDARRTLQHIRNIKLGEKQALYYTTLSMLELHHCGRPKALDALQKGLDMQAEPRRALLDAMAELSKATSHSTTPKKRNLPLQQRASPKRQKVTHEKLELKKPITRLDTTFESQPGTDTSTMSIASTLECPSTTSASGDKLEFNTDLLQEQNHPLKTSPKLTRKSIPTAFPQIKELPNGLDKDRIRKRNSDAKDSIPLEGGKTPAKAVSFTPHRAQFQVKSSRVLSTNGGVRRPTLLSKVPRFANADIGKAVRYCPNQSLAMDTDSEGDTTTADLSPAPCIDKKPAQKPKMDLSYIYEWDPLQHRKHTGEGEDASVKISSKQTSVQVVVETPSTSGTSSSAGTSVSHHSNQTPKLCRSAEDDKSGQLMEQEGMEEQNASVSGNDGVAPSLQFKCNRDFLPLVAENNMLRINNVPYAKLGVIGKGGSCKVYRALAKDCSVYAIKKVKIGGMTKEAIDGYSNEIALLKRLRGSPAIIQLYDSQVDVKKKAIFLVMEVGEVDLNHVLQQQAAEAQLTATDQRTLNMNFIRLTWQQMLSAVHCIHEERIIHGDLKPANFLFVRGALKLIDFGIAKAIQSDDTTNIYRENQIGTLNYMSPEAIINSEDGIKTGRASDIWSLGCILYQMIVGRTPFAELHMLKKLQAIVNPAHQIKYPENVDEDALDVMKLCLCRNANERPPIVGSNGLLNAHSFLN